MDVGFEQAVERAAAFGKDRPELFQAVAGLLRNQRGSSLAQTFVSRDRVTGFVDRIDRGGETIRPRHARRLAPERMAHCRFFAA